MQKDHVRRDRKLAKTHPAAKKCCGWEKPAIYGYKFSEEK